jgi:hypothetical protein
MGLEDRVSSIWDSVNDHIPGGGEDPNPAQQQEQLEENLQSTGQEDFGHLEGASDEDIANEISNMSHENRRSLLKSDEFIENQWSRTGDAIKNDDELSEEFGLNDSNKVLGKGGKKACEHHPNSPVETDQIEPKTSSTVGQSEHQYEGMGEEIGNHTSISGEHGDEQSAHAEYTETRQSEEMDYCGAQPDGCKTSKNGFYRAAESRRERLSEDPTPKEFEKFREEESETEAEAEQLGEPQTNNSKNTQNSVSKEKVARSSDFESDVIPLHDVPESTQVSDGKSESDTISPNQVPHDKRRRTMADQSGSENQDTVEAETSAPTQDATEGDTQSADESAGLDFDASTDEVSEGHSEGDDDSPDDDSPGLDFDEPSEETDTDSEDESEDEGEGLSLGM